MITVSSDTTAKLRPFYTKDETREDDNFLTRTDECRRPMFQQSL